MITHKCDPEIAGNFFSCDWQMQISNLRKISSPKHDCPIPGYPPERTGPVGYSGLRPVARPKSGVEAKNPKWKKHILCRELGEAELDKKWTKYEYPSEKFFRKR